MTETEEKTEEKTEETETTPKNADDMTNSAESVLAALRDTGYTRDETICVLAIANALLNTDAFMSALMENATLVKMPVNMQKTLSQKPSMN